MHNLETEALHTEKSQSLQSTIEVLSSVRTEHFQAYKHVLVSQRSQNHQAVPCIYSRTNHRL